MRRYLVIGLFLTTIVEGYFIYQNDQINPSNTEASVPYQTQVVGRGELSVTIRATGQVETERHGALSFDTTGEVAGIAVEEG